MNLQWSYWDWSLYLWPSSAPLMLLLGPRCLQETVMQQFPWKRKEMERLVLFVWGERKARDVLTREGACHPTLNSFSAYLNLYIRKIQDVWDSGSAKSPCSRQFMFPSWASHPLWGHTGCRTCGLCSAGSNALCLWQLELCMLSDIGWPVFKLCPSSSGKLKSQTCLCES